MSSEGPPTGALWPQLMVNPTYRLPHLLMHPERQVQLAQNPIDLPPGYTHELLVRASYGALKSVSWLILRVS